MTVALKAQHSCLAIHAKPNGEIFVACQHDESKSYQTWLNMASHPNWKSYLTDFVPNLFPWPADDISSYSSRLLEECGFEVLSCHVKQHQQPFQFKEKLKETLRAIFPHLRYIPADKHEEFFDDLLEMAKDIHFISTDYTGTDGTLVLHARKL
uniref:Uncharacterized protein n=1 Tax=Branchiostoma floridae TaxID=7739 RepID=C3Y0Q4_BRAFL|eukprot:XP_002610027.1 hypothetical protein BRAFLDRAFT_99979 [Branchiostoma floridae]